MEPRTFILSAILGCSLAGPLIARAAPGDPSPKPASPPPAAKPVAPPAAAAPAKPVVPVPAPAAKSVASPLAPTPGAAPPPTASAPLKAAGAPSAKLPAPKNPVEAAVQQVVMLERAGRPIGVGTLLGGDGRILTALSPLTHGNQIDARFPEGQVVRVKLSYSDRAWDLALLTPEDDSRHAGLKASQEPTPAAGSKLHAIGYVRDKQLGATDLTIKTKSTLRGCDSAELPDVLELPVAFKASDVGAPLVNDKGEVVAIVARACSATDKLGCTLAPYGAPVSAVRNFLRGVPMRRGPWVGIEAVAYDAGVARGVRVAGIAPNSPAASAGLHAGPPGMGDVVLAVNGTPVATAEAFADAINNHSAAPGVPVRLTVLSEGRYREVALTVREPNPPGSAPERRDQVVPSNPAPGWPRGARPRNAPNPYH